MAVSVKYNHLPRVIETLGLGLAAAVVRSAKNVRDRAKELVPSIDHPGPYATSALQTSIHIATPIYSGYAEATSAAAHVRDAHGEIHDQDLRPQIMPEERPPVERGKYTAWVLAPLGYAFTIEYGNFLPPPAGRRPGPFLVPAAQAEQMHFVAAVQRVLANLGGDVQQQLDDEIAQGLFREQEMIAGNAGLRDAQRARNERMRGAGFGTKADILARKRAGLTWAEVNEAIKQDFAEHDAQFGGGG